MNDSIVEKILIIVGIIAIAVMFAPKDAGAADSDLTVTSPVDNGLYYFEVDPDYPYFAHRRIEFLAEVSANVAKVCRIYGKPDLSSYSELCYPDDFDGGRDKWGDVRRLYACLYPAGNGDYASHEGERIDITTAYDKDGNVLDREVRRIAIDCSNSPWMAPATYDLVQLISDPDGSSTSPTDDTKKKGKGSGGSKGKGPKKDR